MREPYFFPIRHLSPGGAWHLLQFLEEVKPEIVLIEGPIDATYLLEDLVDCRVKPPIALLAYTSELPVKTIMYPLADYSPEYQGIKWAKEHGKTVRFIDLPTEVFLGLEEALDEKVKAKIEVKIEAKIKAKEESPNDLKQDREGDVSGNEGEASLYKRLHEAAGEPDYESFWERNFEHNRSHEAYRQGMLTFGEALRQESEGKSHEDAKNIVRESFMKRQILKAHEEGYAYEKMVVLTGAYHTSNLRSEACEPMEEELFEKLPRRETKLTLMPYSYYRLSSRSGYGAGNKAPYYFEMMWEAMKADTLEVLPECYMTYLVNHLRKEGHIKSSAEVIEGVRLSMGLAQLQKGSMPTLQDLRDGAKTCLGEGHFSKIAAAIVQVEIGSKIGELPDGMSQTALQNDFNTMLKELKLEKYKSVVAEEMTLDLRENRRVKTEKAAFLDLHRSYFLHQLQTLGVSFAKVGNAQQEDANWKELWTLCWRPETEIELVEAALYGDTVQMATAYVLKERLDTCTKVEEASQLIVTCYLCGMSEMIPYAVKVLQALSVEQGSFDQLTKAAFNLSTILRFGSIRKVDLTLIEPLLAELFERSVYLMVPATHCDHKAAVLMAEALNEMDKMAAFHDELVNVKLYEEELLILSNADDKNPKLSGMACSILLERQVISKEMLIKEISRRLLPGIPADIGAGWFEGLASRNRYVILQNLTIWEKLDEYIMSLDGEELKPAVLFLHRSFSDFSPSEKYMIAENLANLWGLDEDDVSAYLNQELSEEEEEMLEDLQDFDF